MISDSLDIPCDTTQPEDKWEKSTNLLYLLKDLNGSHTPMLLSADLLQAKYVNVFAHIYEPVRSVKLPGQSHGPYSAHACVARYFVDGTPPQKGGAAGYKLLQQRLSAAEGCPAPPRHANSFNQQAT